MGNPPPPQRRLLARVVWKLARAHGVQSIAVLHRLSDLITAGEARSEQVQLARGLLSDSETRVIPSMRPEDVAEPRELL